MLHVFLFYELQILALISLCIAAFGVLGRNTAKELQKRWDGDGDNSLKVFEKQLQRIKNDTAWLLGSSPLNRKLEELITGLIKVIHQLQSNYAETMEFENASLGMYGGAATFAIVSLIIQSAAGSKFPRRSAKFLVSKPKCRNQIALSFHNFYNFLHCNCAYRT